MPGTVHLERTYRVDAGEVMMVARTILEMARDNEAGSGYVITEQRHGGTNKVTLAFDATKVEWEEDAAGYRTAKVSITADAAAEGTLVSVFVKPEFVANPALGDQAPTDEPGVDETTAYEILGRVSNALFGVLRQMERTGHEGPDVEGFAV
jgi:hypothetical protein